MKAITLVQPFASLVSIGVKTIETLSGQKFTHQWQFRDALEFASPLWQFRQGDTKFNENLSGTLLYAYDHFEK